jgi:predicted acylesterase/phospholipase RssA
MSTAYVFCGGGAYALPELGVVNYMIENKILNDGDFVIGTSFGAIAGSALVLNFSKDQIVNMVSTFNQQTQNTFTVLGMSWDLFRLPYRYGLRDLVNILAPYYPIGNIPNNLAVCSTEVQQMALKVFSVKDNITILQAVSASASIPFLFVPQQYRNSYYVDGGILDNVPVNHVKDYDNIVIVGYKPSIIPDSYYPVNSFIDYSMSLLNGMISKLNYYYDIETGVDLQTLSKCQVIPISGIASNMIDFSHYVANISMGYENAKQFFEKQGK